MMIKDNYILPAEWEEQECVQLTWPHKDTDWAPYLDDIYEMFVNMAKAIAEREKLIIATPHPEEVEAMLYPYLSEKAKENTKIALCPSNDTWARDHAPITLRNRENGELKMLDFKFNGWGEKFAADKDNEIGRRLKADNILTAEMEDNLDFVLEGGAIESDGKGTIFTTSQCLMAPHRNQPMTQQEIEEELKKRLRAERIVWLDHGNLQGDDTDGHIDTIVRIAPDDTILYMGCDDKEDEQYEDLKAMENQLKALRKDGGEEYRLLKLPSPEAIYDDGERLPATYANFLIINGAVVYPTYRQPKNDAEAERILKMAFPEHEMIAVDACAAIRQHGSIHCLTMQYPKEKVKR